MERMQKTGTAQSKPDALSAGTQWRNIDWSKHERIVRRLQVRIAKATRLGKWKLVERLQYLLTSSFSAKLLAVKKVATNKGKNTAGIDNVTWITDADKYNAALNLKARSYKAKALRRTYIPKAKGKKRSLGIPTMHDRAFQALWVMALEPVAETTADHHSYGFRQYRSVADAIKQCHFALSKRNSTRWVLEGDIKACFDKIDHQWMIDNIPMNKSVLQQWLKAGYIDKNVFHETREGTPQGGVASPVLANMVLDGMADAIKRAVPKGKKVNFVRYADDFICTAKSANLLEEYVLPAIRSFLKERGLALSEEKTHITNIRKGITFLGYHLKKFGHKLVTRPAAETMKKFLHRVFHKLENLRSRVHLDVIKETNRMLNGFANAFILGERKFLSTIDHKVYQKLRRELRRRHPKKSAKWINETYFKKVQRYKWTFFAHEQKGNAKKTHHLLQMSSIQWENYVKIRAKATPFDPEFTPYLRQRMAIKIKKRKRKKLNSFPTSTPWRKFIPGQQELPLAGS